MTPQSNGSTASGGDGVAGDVQARFATADVARILGVSARRVRRMVYAGHCVPSRFGRAYRFAFQDLVLLRTAHGLTERSDIPPRRVNRALRELKKQLPDDRPLSGVRIYAEGGRIVVRDRDSVWQPENGQQVFHFAVDDLASASAEVVSADGARRVTVAASESESAADWFDYGVSIEPDDPNGARQAYERALHLDSEMTDAYINLGRLVHEAGDPLGAAGFYAEALRRSPDDAMTHYNIAVASEDLEDVEAARRHYAKAISINPNFADAHYNLGRLLETAGEGNAAVKHLLAYRRLSDQL